jgi:hypothetical protein
MILPRRGEEESPTYVIFFLTDVMGLAVVVNAFTPRRESPRGVYSHVDLQFSVSVPSVSRTPRRVAVPVS